MNQKPNNTAAAPFTGGAAGANEINSSMKRTRMKKDPNRALEWTSLFVSIRGSIIEERNIERLRGVIQLCITCAMQPTQYPGRIENARELLRSESWLLNAGISSKCAKCLLVDSPYWHYEGDALIVDCYAANIIHSAVRKRHNAPTPPDPPADMATKEEEPALSNNRNIYTP